MNNKKVLCVSETISTESENSLYKMGFSLVKIPSFGYLEKPISSHPDMFMTEIGGMFFCDATVKKLFTSLRAWDEAFNKLVVCGRGADSNKILEYPESISFNCVNVGNNLICNERYTCKSVLEYAYSSGINILNVKQGYVKCSTCVVNSNSIITEDDSICKCAEKNGIEVLKIEKGHVELSGYEYGFIGGCTGLIQKNLLAFNGNLFLHPDCQKIFDFCYDRSVGIVNLSESKLYDIGTIFRIL